MVGGSRCRTEVKSLQESGRVRLEGQGEPGKRPKVSQGSFLSGNIQPCCRDWRTTNVCSLFRWKQDCDVLKVCAFTYVLLLFLSSSHQQEASLRPWSRFLPVRRNFYLLLVHLALQKPCAPGPLGPALCVCVGFLHLPPTVNRITQTCIDAQRDLRVGEILVLCVCVSGCVCVRVCLTFGVWFLDFIWQLFGPKLRNMSVLSDGWVGGAVRTSSMMSPRLISGIILCFFSSHLPTPQANDSSVALISSNTVSHFLTLNKRNLSHTPTPHSPSFHSTSLLRWKTPKQNMSFLLFQTGNELLLFQSGAHKHVLLLKREAFCFQRKRWDLQMKIRFLSVEEERKKERKEREKSPCLCALSLFSITFGSDRLKSPHLKLMPSAPSHWHPGSL